MPLPGPGWEVKYFNELSNLRHGLCKRLVLLSFKWFIIWMNQILPVIAATGKFVPWFKGKSSLGNNRTRYILLLSEKACTRTTSYSYGKVLSCLTPSGNIFPKLILGHCWRRTPTVVLWSGNIRFYVKLTNLTIQFDFWLYFFYET